MSKLLLSYESDVQSSSGVKTKNIKIGDMTLLKLDVFEKIKALFFQIYFDKN